MGTALVLCLVVACLVSPAHAVNSRSPSHSSRTLSPHPVAADAPQLDLSDRFGDLNVHEGPNHRLTFEFHRGGQTHRLTPDQFAHLIQREQEDMRNHGWVFVLFNITDWWGVIWVSVGLLGQLLFTFRMVLQWLASEKEGKSVVPVAFWWGSLLGGLMLLTYFIWRKDIVGVLGQSTGTFIYARNLWLIYLGPRRKDKETGLFAAPDESTEAHIETAGEA